MSATGFMHKGRLPLIVQAERSECALACLAMVLGFFGYRTDLNTLRDRYRLSQHGLTLRSVVNLAAKMHLVARPLRLEVHDLHKLALPAVLHWDLDHFVVLKKINRCGLVVHNPAVGVQAIKFNEAGKHFTGVALELQPSAEFRTRDERQKLRLSAIWRNCAGLLPGLAQLLALSLLLQLFAIALPFYTQVLLDDVLVNHDTDLLKLLAGGFILLALFRALTELVRSHVVLYLGNRISFQFATGLCRHLLLLPQEYFSRRHIGDIVSRFGSLNNVRDFLCSGIVAIVIDGIMVTCTLVLMFLYSIELTFLALAAVLIYALIRFFSYRAMHVRNEEWINDRARENTHFMENISAIQGIKLFGREASRLASWQNCYAATINSGWKVQKLGINIQFAQGLLTGLENIVLLLAGSYAVLAGSMTVGMLMAFVSFKDHLYRSIFSLLDKLFEFRLLDVHLGRLADIAFCEPELLPGTETAAPAGQGNGLEVALSGIAYRHDTDAPMLFRQVNLSLSGNSVVAIIGPTGCGKSTLLKIVASLIQPEEGRLLVDGQAVTRQTLESYRARVSGVMQDDRLLSGSILENITFFDAMPDRQRAEAAARTAMIADDITKMPMQFHTMVGAMGAALSGGQVQRLLLARALYKQPGLLVLDEATSHLDISTENRVNKALRGLQIPCLVVAHRPETVLQADRIYLLHSGGLAALGHGDFRKLLAEQHKDNVITI